MSETLIAQSKLKLLSEKIRVVKIRSEERLKAQHGRFNVFTTLLAAQDEVRLHTRFIHELLDPEGTHDCGDLFLKLFFETLQQHPPGDDESESVGSLVAWNEFAEASYWVGKEVRKPHGQLDFLLESESHVLVIENKIWAAEGNRQVARYAEYVESQHPKSGEVLFLTLHGTQATSNDKKRYHRISYQRHILDWLERCLAATYRIIPVNQVLIQYKQVVEQLTGPNIEPSTMNMIKDYLRTNPEIIAHLTETNRAAERLRVEVLEDFSKKLIERLSDRYIVSPRDDMRKNSFGEDAFGDLKIRAKEGDITQGHPFEIWIEHASSWKVLLIGIESNWKKDRELNDHEVAILVRMREKLLAYCNSEGVHHAEDMQTWWGTHWPVSWFDLIKPFMADDEGFGQMLTKVHFDQAVEHAAKGVHDYMELLKRFYQEA